MQAYILSLVDPGSIPKEVLPLMKGSKHGPHVTLLYIGEVGNDEDVKDDILSASLMLHVPLLYGKFGGVGRFSGSETSQGLDVFYLSVDSAGLFNKRSRLIDELGEFGFSHDRSHGYVPHMTVKFLEASEPSPLDRIEPCNVDLGNLRVVVGKEYVDLRGFDRTNPNNPWKSF